MGLRAARSFALRSLAHMLPSSSSSSALSPARERQVLLVLMLMGFTNIVDFMIMMPLAPLLTREFGITTAQFGFLVSAYAFAASIASLIMASIADRFDRKHVLLLSYGGLIVGTLGCALAPTYATLVIARIVAGAFGGIQSAIALSIVGDLVPDERRGRAMALVMMSFSLAAVLGVPLSIYVASLGGWHVPFFALSALCSVLFIVAYRLIPVMRRHLIAGAKPISLIQGYAELLRVPNHWWAFLTSALIILSGMMVIPFIAPTRVTNEGLSESQLAYFYLIGGAVTIVTRPYFGRLTDRYYRPHVFYWTALLSIIPILLVTHRLGVSLLWQNMVAALFFIFVSGRFIPFTAMNAAASAPQLRGRMMSFSSAVQNFSTGIAASIGGAMLTTSPSGAILGYEAVGYLSCLLTLMAVAAAYRIRAVS
ncbi:MAG: MFS transporter [Betaproteobacteria bacterium]|nr:MAG: MFS transporter [Betaproteobacteria bacterium]